MTPPTTPPMSAALLDDLLPALAGVVVCEAARELLVVPVVVDEVMVVVVKGELMDVVVTEDVGVISELVVLLDISLAPLLVGSGSSGGKLDLGGVDESSGQMPVVQGSLEQHPA